MGASSSVALKFLQWFIRGIQFSCAALILAIFSYFLATLHNHALHIDDWIRAVEGISGAAVLYTLLGLLLMCCLAGHPFTSFIAIVLDICFAAAFIYVAVANKGGASSCNGYVSTPFGTGDSTNNVVDNGNGGFTALPSLRQACQLESACLAVSIIAIFFFIFSAILEVALVRHRRKEKRFGPSPANDYTSGYSKRRGLFSFRRKRADTAVSEDPNALPAHAHPDDVRDSYATEQTRVGTAFGEQAAGVTGTTTTGGNNKYGESGYGNTPAPTNVPATDPYGDTYHHATDTTDSTHVTPAHYPPGNYRYDDGVYNANV